MTTQIITQVGTTAKLLDPAAEYIDAAINELLVNFPRWSDEPDHKVRIERAEAIAKAGGIFDLGETRYSVPSAKTNGEPYEINRTIGTCTCPDYQKHLYDTSKTGWKCKHRIAAYFVIRACELQEQAATVLDEPQNGFDKYVQTLDSLPGEAAAAERHAYEVEQNAQAQENAAKVGKAKRKRSKKTASVEIPQAPQSAGGTWDIAITGEVVHVCADGFNNAAIMGVGADLWCHRCNQEMPHVLMTRENRIAYNYRNEASADE